MRRASAVAAAIILLAASAQAQRSYDPLHPFVTDGDTLKFGPHDRVRLYGIDAPELRQTCDDGAWPAGRIARDALIKIIGGRRVSCDEVDWDSRWNRPVSRCWAGDTDVSEEMVRRGMAWAYVKYSTAFVAQEREAAGLGVHVHNCIPPWEWRVQRTTNEPR
ncbi:MAG: thermonuclease family protein [Alphaproteobacteria bacterium]|nr:thermonuclease family protein [Alphaproteobacteria bacterium]